MNDQYEGQGGSYLIDESGARVLIERTSEQDIQGDRASIAPQDPAPDPEPDEQPASRTKPAFAGFFSPVAPADHPTETE